MPTNSRDMVDGATAYAAFMLMQQLLARLNQKKVITRDEWIACVKDAAHLTRQIPNMTPEHEKAAELLAAMHIGMTDQETAIKPD